MRLVLRNDDCQTLKSRAESPDEQNIDLETRDQVVITSGRLVAADPVFAGMTLGDAGEAEVFEECGVRGTDGEEEAEELIVLFIYCFLSVNRLMRGKCPSP